MTKQTEINYPPYSVLMNVYALECPEYFERALGSMIDQTLPADQITIVCDGPLTVELDEVIDKYEKAHPGLLNVIRCQDHQGIGKCNNLGLRSCRNDIIVRMDSDDISEPERCMHELAEFVADPELDIVSGYIMEFENDESRGYLRTVPTERNEILKYARRRMPFSNVTIAYRKSKVLECGGYRDLSRAEDYDMVARMIMAGARFKTLPELMVRVRVNKDAFKRRKSWKHVKSLIGVRWGLYRMGFTGLWDFAVMSASHILSLFMPEKLMSWLYKKKLRTPYNMENGNE